VCEREREREGGREGERVREVVIDKNPKALNFVFETIEIIFCSFQSSEIS
jgi:hypothetical protein